ncbi:hypothetical protein GCM10022226_33260 [Sphaerisporangium flaviroseum]|uniref:Uncharacterized protein n=1 Tax=Sphaerisporangium flaviroseum TaxID=509199 RepID=A0ABP7I389_9ACTN
MRAGCTAWWGAVQPGRRQAAELLLAGAGAEELAEAAGSFLVEVVPESEPLELSELEPDELAADDEVEDPEELDERLSVR